MEVERLVQSLLNQPSIELVDSILNDVQKITDQVSLMRIVTVMLNHTVPELYSDLSHTQRMKLIEIFQTLVGLGNLVGKIVGLKEMKSPDLDLLTLYLRVLGNVLNDKLIMKLYRNGTSHLEQREIEKLLFKGKIFSVVNELCVKFHIEAESVTLRNTDSFIIFLCQGILDLINSKTDNRVVNSAILSLNSFNVDGMYSFYELIFNEENWHKFYVYSGFMKPFERKKIILGLFNYCRKRYLVDNVTGEKIDALGLLLEFTLGLIDNSLMEYVISSNNKPFCKLIAKVLSNLKHTKFNELVLKSLEIWGDDMVIKNESIGRQETRTFFILTLLFHRRNTIFIKELTRELVFLNSITNRLNSLSNNVKMLGVILSDKICELAQQERIFSFEDSGEFPELTNYKPFALDINVENPEIAWHILNEPLIIEDDVEEISKHLVKLPIQEPVEINENIDSDDESDDEDPTVSRVPKVSKPVYINDLLEYLSVDAKNPQAYDMKKVALTLGPTLIRQKFKFGNEVKFYSESLLKELVGMTNHYQESNFEELRINCIIAVLVTNSISTLYLYKLLLIGDYSLQQRMSILTASSLAARELRGFKDENVKKTFKETSFPSSVLPSGAHELFTQTDYNSIENKIQLSIQDDLMYEASEKAKKELGGGSIIRVSESLKKKNKKAIELSKFSNFSKIIGSHFYFPLVNVWHESGGIDIGHYSPILASHFIRTLVLILHAAYPTAVNINDMVNDLLQITIPLTKKIKLDELQLYEAVATSILLICDIMDEQYIMENYPNEMAIVQKWLSNSWEMIIDDRVKSLCAGLLIKISDMMENFERLLLDQTNSFY